MHTSEQLRHDLKKLGICPGDTVLMHSSYKSLGGIEGGAAAFFEAFMDVLGGEGTLILPALSYATVTREQPVFDRAATPGCVGYLPEFFRTQVPGVIRSLHPSHSCCLLGKRAAEMAQDHELDLTPVGPHSPFARLPQVGGKILMLGCGTGCNTSMHGVEETAEPPYLLDHAAPIDYVLRDGERTVHQHALRHYFGKDGKRCYRQCYSRLIPLLGEGEYAKGNILAAEAHLLSAPAVWRIGHDMLVKDPFYFVEYYEE